jgi:hypothetical protein
MRRLAKLSSRLATSSRTRALILFSRSPVVSSSDPVDLTPASRLTFRLPTRTWKNSSRLSLKMAKNLARSSTGRLVRSASARIRSSKSSQESSRLRSRA